MKEYDIFILRRAQRELAQLPQEAYERVRGAIRGLENPRPEGCVELVGREGWRIGAGDYRVISEIDDKQNAVTVLHVGHRHDIYR